MLVTWRREREREGEKEGGLRGSVEVSNPAEGIKMSPEYLFIFSLMFFKSRLSISTCTVYEFPPHIMINRRLYL